jgi:ribosomal protein S18 acetylase RimI-like enzyme
VTALDYRWNDPADIVEAAAFAGKVIGADPDYISHGEIQTGLSLDGEHWAARLGKLYAEDFADPGERDLLVGRDADGAVRAILIVAWEESPRLRFAVIEDMAVDPAIRSSGIGGRLLELAEARIRERGVEWVFLESGLHNKDAHRFFERHGFKTQSKVFARRLGE